MKITIICSHDSKAEAVNFIKYYDFAYINMYGEKVNTNDLPRSLANSIVHTYCVLMILHYFIFLYGHYRDIFIERE